MSMNMDIPQENNGSDVSAAPSDAPPGVHWPLSARPRVLIANVFPLASRAFDPIYTTTSHALHLHDYHGTIRIDRHQFTLVPGSLTLSPAGCSSSYDLPRPGSHWCIHFQTVKPTGPDELTCPLPLHRDVSRWHEQAASRFAHIIRLHTAAAHDNTRHQSNDICAAAASLALQELLVWFGLLNVVNTQTQTAARDQVVENVMSYIDRNLQSPISAADIVARSELSQNYLAKIFKQQTGMSIPKYLMTQRMALAKMLLRSTDLSIKQIGIRVSYADPQHFNKLFRTIVGKSPSVYRKLNA
jgi:AraC-like DNA-binding protein